MKPVFDATENFFYAPSARTQNAPHIRDPLDLKRFMSMVIIGLAPCVVAAFYFFGLRMLAMIVVSYAAGGAVEMLFAVVRKEEINEGFLVTGLIFPLILPPGLPLWIVAVGVAFGVLVGKEIFGGTGRNPFNPALVGRCFLVLGYPGVMSATYIVPGSGPLGRLTEYVGVEAMTRATPLAEAKQGVVAPIADLFWGNVTGSAGETAAIAIIVGGVFLVLTRVANWRTVAGIIGSFTVLGLVLHYARPDDFAPVGWHLLAGGLLFGAFFMATDPVTSPITNGGKWAYAVIIGAATLLIRNLTGYVEGMMFAILLGNIAAPVLDDVAVRLRLRRLQHEG
ncbi:MAG: RnfABCDGE type electron transport complex subunit D [Planctomycetes bacterium]|nr:RnfABCDGE type electron transport complex subunit D [Planctomycetota bacterium]